MRNSFNRDGMSGPLIGRYPLLALFRMVDTTPLEMYGKFTLKFNWVRTESTHSLLCLRSSTRGLERITTNPSAHHNRHVKTGCSGRMGVYIFNPLNRRHGCHCGRVIVCHEVFMRYEVKFGRAICLGRIDCHAINSIEYVSNYSCVSFLIPISYLRN